jgi:hypothetical protein
MSDRCNQDIFNNGLPLMLVDTGNTGGAAIFERWIQGVAFDSGQLVDWHYSGGIAQVLALGDWSKAQRTARQHAVHHLPDDMTVMRWCRGEADGIFRAGVSEAPEGAIAAYMDPITGEQVFMVSPDPAQTPAEPPE